ncbi:hypothetical protein FQA39_LY06461 [Lamprigera yunnana]|nr:hypothetical protein FQA39_LY06461 [Lamprigera yunnana]
MGFQYCAVVNCFNNSGNSKYLKFFRVPKDLKRRQQWLECMGRTDLTKEPERTLLNRRVCSQHFHVNMLARMCGSRLRKNAEPTLFEESQGFKAFNIATTSSGVLQNVASDSPTTTVHYEVVTTASTLEPSQLASPLTADFNFPAPISDLATADMELVHELPGPSSSTADFNFPAPISDLATADMELVHELPGPSSSTADFNFPAPISDLATADMELVHELPGPSSSTADFNFPAPISDLATADMELVHELPATADMELVHELPGPSSSTADFNFPAPISDLATADMELVHELPGPSSSTADFNFPAPISDLATADMELVHELPGPSSTSTVPSPFKKHFFYVPTEVSNDTKRKPKEKLPTVAFGEDYVIYLKRKMEKKENLAKQKLERANERKRKKAEKDALMEQKKLEREDRKRLSSAESDIDDKETDEDDSDSKLIPPKKVNGEFVIVRYDGRFYPGKIITALPLVPSISAMARVGRLWKWPVRPDVCEYEWKNVITTIKEPQKTSKTRDLFNVPEMKHFQD